jgi:eukaryotic-like serine/threonine-protein kinase
MAAPRDEQRTNRLTGPDAELATDLYFELRGLPAAEQQSALEKLRASPAVKAEVRSLLEQNLPADFLVAPIFSAAAIANVSVEEPQDPLIGQVVRSWKIERLLGTGGMGSVYLASRADRQFEQRVAVKVVKRGMDTDELLRRFRAEQRTLGQLRHPNIAALLDAGSLVDGRPYLIMEYVDGSPINLYCRERQLGTEARLKLFIAVCGAVQFAHKNLVIHRDIKPGNILVTGDGIPKLLDFGVAKVMELDRSMTVTGMDQRPLTPEYASPEQVEGRPVTTATDVYSLGVVLYELLSGVSPYTFKTRSAAEIIRTVVSTTPEPPSTAVLSTHSARRDISPVRLRKELQGDLDTIALMAMRKEPERRYASTDQLADDIGRYLKGLPVTARRDTLGYRTVKFLKRNALASTLGLVAALGLGVGVAAVAIQSQVVKRQRDQAFTARDQSEATTKFLRDMLESASPFKGGPDLKVRDVLDQAAARLQSDLSDRPLVQASLRSTIGTAYLGLGEIPKAEREIRASYDTRMRVADAQHHDVAEAHVDMGTLLYHKQEFAEAEKHLLKALEIFRSIRGDHNADIARVQNNLGPVLRSAGRTEAAIAALEDAVRIRRADSGPRSLELAESLNNYGNALRQANRLADAEIAVVESLSIRTEVLGELSPLVAQSTANLAVLIHSQGDLDRAAPLYAKAIELERQGLGEKHPDRAYTLNSYATLLKMKKDWEAAAGFYRQALELRAAAYPAWDLRLVSTRLSLVEVLSEVNGWNEADDQMALAVVGAMAQEADEPVKERVRNWGVSYYKKRGNHQRAREIETHLTKKDQGGQR